MYMLRYNMAYGLWPMGYSSIADNTRAVNMPDRPGPGGHHPIHDPTDRQEVWRTNGRLGYARP